MIPISKEEINRWRVEIELAEKFRDEEFGEMTEDNKTLAGENVGYYETGLSGRFIQDNQLSLHEAVTIFNIIAPIVDNVMPSLSTKNPYISSVPKRKREEDQLSAPIAGEILNYRYRELSLERVNDHIKWDGYVLGRGVSKIGYTTKFGTSPTENTVKEETKEREKGKLQKLKESLGIGKKKKEEVLENPELNEFIRSESPFVCHISPFKFLMDPRGKGIEDCNWVGDEIRKRLVDVKKDKTYKNTSKLKGEGVSEDLTGKVDATQIDYFKDVILYEIHYKTDTGINILTLAKNENEWKALRHDENALEIDGFQYELLDFNKHKHRLWPISDITKIRGLQDRLQQTIENILEQVDKFVPKLIVDQTGLSEEGRQTLEDGGVGAIVWANKNPNEVMKEASFTQIKADLLVLIDRVMDIAMLMTGLTKAQLLGLTSADTATEAQIGQAGQNLRLNDKANKVTDYLERQARKLWQVEKQFTDFEEIDLITGEQTVDPQTGLPRYSWFPDIDSTMSENLAKGEYRFEISVGSVEKPDLPILRKQIENLVNILGGKGVLEALAAQGWKVELAEVLKEYMGLYPNMFKIPGKVLKPIKPPPGFPGQAPGGQTAQGAAANPQLAQQAPPNIADIISSTEGEKGQIPIA